LNTALAKKYGREDEQSLIKSANAAWLNAKDESQRFFQSPSEANTMESVAQLQNYLQNILDHLAKLTQHAREEVSLELLQAQKLQNMSVGWLIAMFVFAMAIAVLSAMIMGQTILKPLKALEEGVVHLRSGDHSYRVDPPEASELRHLAVTFNTMADEIERNTNMLMEKSKRDSLTSLLNHGEFHNIFKTELERASRYQRPLSLLMLDIDHFKSVNDNYGHPAGDKVIQAIGSVLSKGLRPSDVAARYGGEEFTIILPETEKEKAFYLAERIRNSIAGTQMPLGRNGIISVTVSIGIAAFAENGTLTEDIIEAADQALYKAKKLGRNRTQCA
jgi:diguanylate cyclase (GGDEF)-like protein